MSPAIPLNLANHSVFFFDGGFVSVAYIFIILMLNLFLQKEEEWIDFQEPTEKDYSGLRIQSLQIG